MQLVDTSVWIDFLRGKSNERVEILEALLQDGSAYLCEIVFIEVCAGARDAAQFKKYQSYFQALPFVYLARGWEAKVSEMIFKTRKAGKTLFLADAIIGHLALENRLPLLTSDKDFQVLKNLFDLKIQ